MELKTNIPSDWKLWIQSNLEKGVGKTYIFNVLIENGFSYQSVAKEMKFEPELQQTFSSEWKDWLDENIAKKHDKDGIFKVLLMHGFSFDAIKLQMKYEPSVSLDHLEYPIKIDRNSTNNIKLSQLYSYKKKQLLIQTAKKLQTKKLEIFYINNFLNKNECKHLIKTIRSKLRPSELSSPDSDRFFRTSKTCDLAEVEDNIIRGVDDRICDLLEIKKSLSEPIQGQYYEVGQEFKPHTDFFENHELKINGGTLGQRSYTVMIYLNSTELGGETTFPLIDKEFSPAEGKALIWCNLNPDLSPNPFSMHHAKQVRRGYKAIITKWFRTGIPTVP